MKRMIYLAAALLLAACSREALPETPDPIETPQNKTYSVSLQATFDPETRLSFDLGNEQWTWTEDDKVALFTHKGKKIEGEIRTGDFSAESPTFTFTLEDDDYIAEGATVYYPASIAVDENHIQLLSNYASAQSLNRSIPMKASVNAGKMAFQLLASIIYVAPFSKTPSYPSYDQRPQSVEFSVQGSNAISGMFTVDGLSLTASGDNGTTITAPWAVNEPYYFALPPATYQFSVSIKAADGFIYYKKSRIKTPYEAARKNLLQMPAFDPQCKEFYLTGTATGWSDANTNARMIQSGDNTFIGALYSYDNSGQGSDYGFKILQGFNTGAGWDKVIGVYENSTSATYGNVGNLPASDNRVYGVTLTLGADHWTAESWRTRDEYGDYDHAHLYLVFGPYAADSSTWTTSVELSQPVGHNWKGQVTIGNNSNIPADTKYGWKVNNGNWYVQWNKGEITDNKLYSSVDFNNSDTHNGSLTLSAGTYDVFFNDAIGRIMFVKK
ncbi:MAG: hypothetical protein IJK29_01545 [Bacteroidales bacterium]|nr:hypothetical protein [Bacteroidales bacterium]